MFDPAGAYEPRVETVSPTVLKVSVLALGGNCIIWSNGKSLPSLTPWSWSLSFAIAGFLARKDVYLALIFLTPKLALAGIVNVIKFVSYLELMVNH